jgi:uncharacterized protein
MKRCVVSFSLFFFLVAVTANAQKPGAQKPNAPKPAAQKSNQAIRVLADGRGDSVILRWAPSTAYLWLMANKYGYTIERFTIKEGDQRVPTASQKAKLLTTGALKPVSQAAFLALEETDDRSAVVGEAIYGKEFELEATAAGTAGIMQQTQAMQNRFSFAMLMCDLSPVAARAAALSFTDRDVKPGNRYIYRIKLAQQVPNLTYDPGVVVTDGNERFKLNNINDLAAEFSDHTVMLRWPIFLNDGVYSAYIVERSEDGIGFTNISPDPLVNTSQKDNTEYAHYIDSLDINGHTSYYRIRGISPFGETGPPSNIISGKGKDEMAAQTIVDSAVAIDKEKVRLTWHLDNPKNQEIKGFWIMKASKDEGPYTELNKTLVPPDVFTYVDSFPGRSNYYRVKTVLSNDDISISYSRLALMVDSMPPAIPTAIAGTIDSLGIVRLKWEDNQEEDLHGYRVFRANGLNEEFVEVTSNILARPSFKDTVTLHTLTSRVFYKIVSVDNNFNASQYSEAFELKRPDTIAPAKPVFGQIRRVDTTVNLNWVQGHGMDLARHVLYRADQATGNREKLTEWNAAVKQTTFIDKGLLNGGTYNYILEAYDSTGNTATAISRDIEFETGIRKPIADISAKAEREKRLISINWKYAEKDIAKIVVYRSKQGEPATIYETLSANPGKFEDTNLFINNTYVYKIQAVFKGGARSPISKELIVKY